MYDIKSLLQIGKQNTIALNKTRNFSQRLELKTDIFSSIIFLSIALFILIVIVILKQKLKK